MNYCWFSLHLHFSFLCLSVEPTVPIAIHRIQKPVNSFSAPHMQCLRARSWNEYVQLLLRCLGVCTKTTTTTTTTIIYCSFFLLQLWLSAIFFSFVFVSATISINLKFKLCRCRPFSFPFLVSILSMNLKMYNL